MAEAEDSVRALADSFMAGWLALESRQSSSKKKDEIELVNRMVQLFSWYLILNQFKELESEWPCGGSEVQQSQYKTMWKQVLQGWSMSVDSSHLSSRSLKLLKVVIVLERLNSCHMKVQTSATYSDLAKLLFCISKFSELGKDTRDQQTLADLCAEAKSLEMVHVISSQDMYSCSRQWTSREQDFVKHTRKILLHIVAKKLEKPPMFVPLIEQLENYLERAESREESNEKDSRSQTQPPVPLPAVTKEGTTDTHAIDVDLPDIVVLGNEQNSISANSVSQDKTDVESKTLVENLTIISSESCNRNPSPEEEKKKVHPVPFPSFLQLSVKEEGTFFPSSSVTAQLSVKMEDANETVDYGGLVQQRASLLPEIATDEGSSTLLSSETNELPIGRAQSNVQEERQSSVISDAVADEDRESRSETVEMAEVVDEEKTRGTVVLLTNSNASSSSSSSQESTNLLQLPYVRDTVQWSSDESSDIQSDASGEHRRQPLIIRGGTLGGFSTAVPSTSSSGRVFWAGEEVEYLKEGVERFGIGNWKKILSSYPFHSRRTNVDLKDKWRNLQRRQ